MAQPLLVDTDVMVDYLRGRPEAVTLVQSQAGRIILSSIVTAELYAGVKGEAELRTVDALLALFRIVPVTAELGRAGGLYKEAYGRSHGVGLADALVAATADAEGAELLTLNVKHYPMFAMLRPAYVK